MVLINRFSFLRSSFFKRSLVLMVVVFFSQSLNAATKTVSTVSVEGNKLPEKVEFVGYDAPLVLQGAGIRSKFVVDVYVGGLYLEQKIKSRTEALNLPGAKRMYMGFLRTVSGEKIKSSWYEGIRKNNDYNLVSTNKKTIDNFVEFFNQGVKKGDIIFIDNIPEEGVAVTINGVLVGVIKNNDFFKILLATWMGNKPPGKKFQKQLLGQNKG